MKTQFLFLALVLSSTVVMQATDRSPDKHNLRQIAELTSSDGYSGDDFGGSIAISGDTIAIGAPLENGYEGAIYVFVKPAGGWANMTQVAKLTLSNAGYGDFLGSTISMTGDTIVSGGETPTTSTAYVFSKPATGWTDMTETAVLTDGARGDSFGGRVAAVGNTIVVAARAAFDQKGAAYIFFKPAGGWQTTSSYAAQLTASDGQPGDLFGTSLASNGKTITLGAPFATIGGNQYQGKVYVFSEPPSGWATTSNYAAELTASDGTANTFFGDAVTINGGTIAVGVLFAGPNGSSQGAAYVFVEPAGGWTTTTETAELSASDGAGGELGIAIATSGNTIVAGAVGALSGQGAAYLFDEPASGWVSTSHPNAHLTVANNGTDAFFGSSAVVGKGIIVIGALQAVVGGYDPGAAYIFAP